MSQTASFLTQTELVNSGLLETSISGKYGLLTVIPDGADVQIYMVIRLEGNDWVMEYCGNGSYEDVKDVFSIYDIADLEESFNLFDFAEEIVTAA